MFVQRFMAPDLMIQSTDFEDSPESCRWSVGDVSRVPQPYHLLHVHPPGKSSMSTPGDLVIRGRVINVCIEPFSGITQNRLEKLWHAFYEIGHMPTVTHLAIPCFLNGNISNQEWTLIQHMVHLFAITFQNKQVIWIIKSPNLT